MSNTKVSQEDKKQIAKRVDEYYNIALNFARQGRLIGAISLNLYSMLDLAREIDMDVRKHINHIWDEAPTHMSPSLFKVPSDLDAECLLVIEPKAEEITPYYRIVQKSRLGKTIVQARRVVCNRFVGSSKSLQAKIKVREEAAEKRRQEKILAELRISEILSEAKTQFEASGEYLGKVQELIQEAQCLVNKYQEFVIFGTQIQEFLNSCLGLGKSESTEQINELLEQSVSVEKHSDAQVLVEA